MVRCKFTNPADGSFYEWAYNPPFDGIPQGSGKTLAIERLANTGNVGAVKQQGDDGPFILHYEPLIWTAAHQAAMWMWYKLSKKQSIYFTSFTGDEYEGQITTLTQQEIGATGGPGDTNARGYYVKMVFEFEVWRTVSGMLHDVGVVM